MEPDRAVVEKYFLDELPENLSIHESFELLLVIIEKRPAALVMSPSFKDRKLLRSFCDKFDLHYLEVEGQERSLLDKILRRDTRVFKGGFFISQNEERFEKLKSSEGDFYGFSDKAVGSFLDYPDEAIEYFEQRTSNGEIGSETEKILEDLIDDGEISRDEAKYVELISYLPKPDKSNILKAIQKGKERKNDLQEFDENFNVEIARRYLDDLLE